MKCSLRRTGFLRVQEWNNREQFGLPHLEEFTIRTMDVSQVKTKLNTVLN